MADVTVILTAYRRPELLADQVAAVRDQTVEPHEIWIWANEPGPAMLSAIDGLGVDRVVTSSRNAYVHARFALALLAGSEFLALFDDDTVPGPRWFENCLDTFRCTPGILGSAGVRIHGSDYRSRSVHGWHDPAGEVVEVDLVGHAWFLRAEWVRHLFAAPSVTGTNGEDIELSARAWRLAGIRTFCPPHPPRDRDLWGSLKGDELGTDGVALSRRPGHLEERDRIVRAEIAAGWIPYTRRGDPARLVPRPRTRPAQRAFESEETRGDGTGSESSEPVFPITTTSAGSARAEARSSLHSKSVPESASAQAGEATVSPPDPPVDDRSHWRRVHLRGHRVLVVGHDVAPLAMILEGRGPAKLVAVELDGSALERGHRQIDEVHAGDDEGAGPDFPDGSFDGIVCDGLLERVRRPDRLLRRLRRWLAPDGRLLTGVGNVRRLDVVESLLGGRWAASEGSGSRRSIRFFTRREVEKLLFRAGFETGEFTILSGRGHHEWVASGRPGKVKVGRLQIGGLSPDEAEEFFARGYLVEAAPAEIPERGKTSIVVVTHNEIAYTRQCVESLRRLTDEPHELIFVDNASSDGTDAYLRSLPGAKLIVNAENRGFPAAVNQALAVAEGDQVLLLNNDTVVTTGWLRRMLDALHRDSKIGLVGPCSNCISGGQQVGIRYDDLSGLDGFAWEWGKANEQAIEDTQRLIGFCLLIRREVIDEIGLLDERFGIGCFEDDDFCLRATRAGWRAVIARDSFVHHFGGRTFVGSGADFAGIMRENGQRFREKWGAELRGTSAAPAIEQPEGPPEKRESRFTVVMAPGGGLLLKRKLIRLSLCMIVRDSSRTLPACLESIYPWVDELVIVDTGSTDETPRIVESFGGRLFHFPWCDDFSAARNESLRHARGQWIFWMDSDDTITEDCGRKLRQLVYGEHEPAVLGYVAQVHCPGGGEDGCQDVTAVDHVKLFRNHPDLRFDGRIHEQILPAIRRAGGEVAWTDLYVVHSGVDHSLEAQERKRERDLRILHQELKERPEHPFTLFNLGMTYVDGNECEEAESYLLKSIANSGPHESHLRKAYALLMQAQVQLRRLDEALDTCNAGLELFPEDIELRFREGVLLHQLGRLTEAESSYLSLLRNDEPRHFTSVDQAIRGYKTWQNLALLYTDLGELAKAERQWRQVVRELPRYRPGWLGLVDSLLRRDKMDEATAVAEELLRDDALRSTGLLLKARIFEVRGDVSGARASLEEALKARSDDLDARRGLCQLLFDRASPVDAERALRELVLLDPADASAYHNLGTLYLRMRRYRDAAQSYRESLRHRPNAAVTHLHLGYSLKESGRPREAAEAFQEVLRIDPGNRAAREELERLGHPSAKSVLPFHPART